MDVFTILAIILFIAGFVLVGIEIVLPGFSMPGVAGIICLVAGIFIAADSIREGVIITLIVLALLVIMLVVLLKLLSSGKIKSPIVLQEAETKSEGYISSGDLQYLLGKEGVALTDLRPTGRADFDGISFDVITEGKYIVKDTALVIHKVQGSKLIVREK